MEEMLDDTLEGLDEDSELEDEAEAEVDQVLYEITDGKLGVAGAGKELPVRSKPFPALHCFILTRIPESQRPRGGSGERSGNGTDASSAEQSAQWIIEALRARCTRIFTSPSRLFMFLFAFISRSGWLLYSFNLIENLRQHFRPSSDWKCCPLARSSMLPGARVQLRCFCPHFCPSLRVPALKTPVPLQAFALHRGYAVAAPTGGFAGKKNANVRLRPYCLGCAEAELRAFRRESTPSRSFLVTVGLYSIQISVP